ncbi:hypothetical protein H8D29_04685 [PVC group bacterium]|nr:hypothetical protein [PVC group bacterium]
MDGETLIQIGTLLTVVIGLFGILIGIKKHNEQTTALILIEYAKRYEIIMASLPQEVQEVFYSRGTDFKTTEKVDRNVLEYFKLC